MLQEAEVLGFCLRAVCVCVCVQEKSCKSHCFVAGKKINYAKNASENLLRFVAKIEFECQKQQQKIDLIIKEFNVLAC